MQRHKATMAGLLGAACVVAGGALAQTYPSKPVRIIVVFPPGSVLEAPVRAFAQRFGGEMGQPFIVENRQGAEGLIGTAACARSAPDGYTTCLTSGAAITFNPLIRKTMDYDAERDLEPVAHIGSLASAIVVHPSVQARTLNELLDLARRKPGSVSWGSFGLTSQSHIMMIWLKREKNIEFLDVPYKSALQSTQAAIAGEVDVATFGVGTAMPFLKSGKLRALAVNGDARSSLLPDSPPLAEFGLDIVPRAWFGFFVPAGVPKDIIRRLNTAIGSALADPAFSAKFVKSQGLELDPPAGESPEKFTAAIRAERESLRRVIDITGLKEQ